MARDDVEAARWFWRAAEQGDAFAQNNLGFMHYIGRGVLENRAAAVVWFRRAAEQGNAVAQRNLGLAYREGHGVPGDDLEAARWLQRAAEQGDTPAQLHLGRLYEHGIGVARDPIVAYVWFSRVAAGLSGEEATRAMGERDVVSLLLTPDELARGRALVEAWQSAQRQGTTPEASAVSAASLIPGDTAFQLPKDLIPRKALFALRAEKPRISPDGRRLAYVAPAEGMLRVWVRSVDGDDDRVLTSDQRHGIHGLGWQCDSAHILSLRDQDGDERWRLYQSALGAETTRDLTPDDGERITTVRVDCRSPGHALLEVHRRNRTGPDVYRVHLRSGVSKLDTENPGDVIEWLADADLRVRAAESLGLTGPMIRVRSVGRSTWRALKRWSADLVGFSGPQSLELVSDGEAPAKRLLRVDIETGAVAVLAEDPRYDVADLLVHPRTGTVQAVAFVRTRREWTVIDDSIRADFEVLGKVRAGIIAVVSRDLEDRIWIVGYEADDAPPEYFAYDRATRRATPLLRRNSALERYVLARMRPIAFQARDGMALHGYLTLPVDGTRPAPLVVLVHGGPWERDVWGWHPEVQWLANRGYAVLQVNFRGSAGYGRAYLQAGDLEWGDKMLKDLLDGKAWAVREGYADPRKACIMGASYGGYATLSALTFAPSEFACGIALAAPSDLVALARSRWSLVRPFMDRRLGHLDRDEDLLRARSPLFAVERLRAPLLMAHGGNDPNVSRLESDQFVTAARTQGKPVAYLVFPDEGHGLTRLASQLRFYAAVEQFLAQHLGGRVEPPSPDEDWRPLSR